MNIQLEKILQVDDILTGSIIERYSPCGKKNCKCAKDKKHWHGPYYIWTRKEKGKTVTKSLTKEQASFCRKAIKNMKKLQNIIAKWRNASIRKMQKV